MAVTSTKLEDLLPPEQCDQLAELLAPVLAKGYGVVVLYVENHRIHHIGPMPFYLAARPAALPGQPPEWFSGEGGHA